MPLGGNIGLTFLCLLIFLSERAEKPATELNLSCSKNHSVDQNIMATAKTKINTDTTPAHSQICKSDIFQGDTLRCGNA